VSADPAPPARGITPFVWFGVAIAVGAAWALFMGLSYYNVPTFTESALPTIAGVAIAVVAFLVIGAWAPANE
jgi:membrane-bound acyltransferase YfiQ involved in biofilm formation